MLQNTFESTINDFRTSIPPHIFFQTLTNSNFSFASATITEKITARQIGYPICEKCDYPIWQKTSIFQNQMLPNHIKVILHTKIEYIHQTYEASSGIITL